MQVVHHPPNQQLLLVVFLAKDRQVGANDLEKSQHHRCDTTKMPRPYGPLKHVRESGHFDECCRSAARVDCRLARCKDQIHAGRVALRKVGLECPRISGEVFSWPELRGIDEDRHHDIPCLLPACSMSRKCPSRMPPSWASDQCATPSREHEQPPGELPRST